MPKIQLFTVADLLSGKARPQYFDLSAGLYNFKKAKVEKPIAEQKKLL